MCEIKNVFLVGLGAIGSIYASKFYDCPSVNFKVLVTQDRLEYYSKNPLIFNGIKYDFEYTVTSENTEKADLIIISTKNNSLLEVIQMIRPLVKKDTIIISLLNGINSEELLIKEFGKKNVLYSYFIGHASEKTDRKINHDGVGTVVFGELCNKEITQNVLKVKNLFESANIKFDIPEDMLASMWKKFIINVGINQTSAILKADYRMLQVSKEARILAYDLMFEAVCIAKSLGVKDALCYIDDAFELIDKMPPDLKSSMFQDVENNRETEVDVFAGEVIRLGKLYGIKTPLNQFVYDKLKSLENDFIRIKDDLSVNLN